MKRGNLDPLIELLDSGECPIVMDVRQLLARMLRADKYETWRLEAKRKRGKEAKYTMRWMRVGWFIHKQYDDGVSITSAKEAAATQWSLDRRMIDNEWRRYRYVYNRFLEEGGSDISEGLRPLRKPIPRK